MPPTLQEAEDHGAWAHPPSRGPSRPAGREPHAGGLIYVTFAVHRFHGGAGRDLPVATGYQLGIGHSVHPDPEVGGAVPLTPPFQLA